MSNNKNPYDLDGDDVRAKSWDLDIVRAEVLDVLPDSHAVRVQPRGEAIPIVAPVLTLTDGSHTLPAKGQRVVLAYITDNTPVALGGMYLADGTSPPDVNEGDLRIGNGDEHITFKDGGGIESSTDLGGSYDDEAAQDATAALITGGNNVTASYDDANDELIIDGFSGSHNDLTNVSSNDHHTRYSDEEAQDASASMITGGNDITTTYDDAGNTFTIDSELSGNLTAKLFLAEGSNTNINQTTTVSWNNTTLNDDVFTWDGSSQLTIDNAGRYEIHAEADFTSSGDTRQSPNLFIHQNNSIVGVGGRSGYMRDNEGHDHSSVHSHAVINANSGDVIDVESRADGDTTGSVTPDRAMFYIIRLEEDTINTPSAGYFDANLTTTQTNAENGFYVNVAESVNQNDGWTVNNSSDISPNSSGTYKIEYTINFHRTGSDLRNVMIGLIERNGTNLEDRTKGAVYIRTDISGDEGDVHGSTIIDLNAGDNIRVWANEERGGETGNDIERASINAHRIN